MGTKKPRKASDDEIWFAPRGSLRVKLRKIKEGLLYTKYGRIMHMDHKGEKSHDISIYGCDVEYHYHYKNVYVLHRDDGPAKYSNHDNKEHNCKFYYNGFHITKLSQYFYLCDMDEVEQMIMHLKYGEELT
jgi:hypothetical protein